MIMINPLECFYAIQGHATLDRNAGLGCNTLLLRLIPRNFFSACPHRQFNKLPGLLHSQFALPNSYMYLNTCVPSREAVCTISKMVFGYDLTGVRTSDLLHERLTHSLSHPNAVTFNEICMYIIIHICIYMKHVYMYICFHILLGAF